MYSFIIATALSVALSLLSARAGRAAAIAAVLSMFLFALQQESAVLAELPYVGVVAVSLDTYKMPFILTSIVLGLIVTIYAPRYLEHLNAEKWYYAVQSLYVLSFVYIIIFENLIFVFLALELSIITSFLLIWYFGYGDRKRVGLLFFIWSQIGSILFLIGVALSGSFSASNFTATSLAAYLVLIGLLIKMGTLGAHFWLPYAHAEAPTPLSALLSPVHVGLMAYWIWRLKAGAAWPLELLYAYGLATAIYGSLLVFRESDIKRALADSTIANMGLLVAAAAINHKLSYDAVALLFVGHAFAKAAGFMLSGIYIVSLETRLLDRLKWDLKMLALGISTFIALAGVFGINLLGKALVAIGAPHNITIIILLITALFSTALYSFYLLNRLYKGGSGPVPAPRDMYVPAFVASLAPHILLLGVFLWL
ncbi:complex I subunit 5 family protein [Pyrobaculum aerophilum]|uniref:NADH-ubiquinone oxidoreductase n=1 Tax=Pyrobaculum aerophilum TaxID=13773 RepID=A0A371R2B8_9CREN|nr:complex I subunit 5 family protein [Pyrobaculum aerophilum]RFA97685.1 NADH-ubiquinone oxidoreductase [Pyrobaculum aerophilum]RFA99497.1 NADH-ubiquinone oxidoreductase [Pyrobaculum aerophilum]